jgi:hypothetical protein
MTAIRAESTPGTICAPIVNARNAGKVEIRASFSTPEHFSQSISRNDEEQSYRGLRSFSIKESCTKLFARNFTALREML